MNIRFSNLSYHQRTQIRATDSVKLFDGTDVHTVTDTTIPLVPIEEKFIEGTMLLKPSNQLLFFFTDHQRQNVVVSSNAGVDAVIPFDQNIAIEWNDNLLGISAY